MDTNELEKQIAALSAKMDLVLEEMELQKRRRRETEDMKDDLMRVGKEVYSTAVNELEEMHDSFEAVDLMHLGKRMLRNVRTIDKSVQQLESAKDFLEDAAPLAREYIMDFMQKLDEYDRKGYFRFFSESVKITDRVVSSFSPEDVRNLADNVVTILNTVKNLTQPDMLQSVNSALKVYKKLDIEVTEEVSLYRLLKEMNTPEARRGMAFAIRFLKSLAETKKDITTNN